MTIPRVYVDTSVFGGCFDTEFQEDSLAFFNQVKAYLYTLVISELTVAEIEQTPNEIKQLLEELPTDAVETISLTPEALTLQRHYIQAGVVGESTRNDALHVALATLSRVDVVLSWNFKHLVNVQKIRGFNAVNLREGYCMIDIRSPKEVLYDADKEV